MAAATIAAGVLALFSLPASAVIASHRDLTIDLGDFTTKAQLAYPAGARPAPLVVLVAGAGAEDLNADDASPEGTSRGHLFADVSRALVQRGFAVLRYNKHYVNGIGDIDPRFFTALTMRQLVTDVHTVVRAGSADRRVDPRRVFLFSWSEGTTVAAAAAPAIKDLRGIVFEGVVGIPWRTGLIAQWNRVEIPYLRRYATNGSVGPAELTRAWQGDGGVVAHELVGLVAPDIADGKATVDPAFDPNHDGRSDLDKELAPTIPAYIDAQLANGVYRFYGPGNGLPEVASQAKALRNVAVLTVHGHQDANVPVDAAFRADQALAAAGNRDHVIRVYPRSGHSLGYAADLLHDPIGPIQPRALTDIANWFQQRVSS